MGRPLRPEIRALLALLHDLVGEVDDDARPRVLEKLDALEDALYAGEWAEMD